MLNTILQIIIYKAHDYEKVTMPYFINCCFCACQL